MDMPTPQSPSDSKNNNASDHNNQSNPEGGMPKMTNSFTTKEAPNRKITRNKSKTATTSAKQTPCDTRVKSKRQKVNNECETSTIRGKRELTHAQNGAAEKELETPTKNSKHTTPTSDFGRLNKRKK
ncbi:hypothetical protein TSAR_014224 [Trichomalopsis sarcophagae]|uniref:Uncharacterized protein n=1 Tax=Trichomalopsis sarcophagae TaxID=543379 RepID=A0A232FLY1_9HYME|nr:hypothetical protein TSAR_014224 [Trichomalopsis sarcophagae]